MRLSGALLALMLLTTFAFVGFVVYKFLSYLGKESSRYRGPYRQIFKTLFDDKHRLN
ncbi:MAG: hypothetical protein NZM06_06440 [Chloroherpetonaceae bacterium]|nr:hypothetical protein [Chloroherpetonaceae bacterium]MDW8438285.1 hypothetical protein [Chloroherpetonaceae bacterium]